MRTRGRIDGNQNEIVSILRNIGATVLILSSMGKGCPDILVGFKYHNYLMELKDPEQPESKRFLTPDEVKFAHEWKGQVNTVTTINDAFRVIHFNGVLLEN